MNPEIKKQENDLREAEARLLEKLIELKGINEKRVQERINKLREIDESETTQISIEGEGATRNTEEGSEREKAAREKNKGPEKNTTEPQEPKNKATEGGIPLFISRDTRQQLSDLGYTKKDIAQMLPEEALDIISNQRTKKKEEAVITAVKPETGIVLEDEVKTVDSKKVATPDETVKKDEKKVKSIREKIFGFFKRKEKEESPYEKAEKEEFRKNIESRIARGEKIEDIRDLYLKKTEEKNKRELEEGPLSARLKNGILKGVNAWEKFGVEEKNNEGKIVKVGSFKKRMVKMGVNIALISLISMSSVDKFAQHGIGTATALTTTTLGSRMGTGLLIGASLDKINKVIPPKLKKWMPLAVAGISVSAATVLTGGLAAPALALTSSGLGYLSTKYVKGNFTEEKILAKEKKAKEDFQKNLINKDGKIKTENIRNVEKDYLKLLKKYENMRIFGKLLDEVTKILSGSLVAGLALEASGKITDYNKEIALAEQHKVDEAVAGRNEEISGRADEIVKAREEVALEAQQNLEQNTEIIAGKGDGAISMFKDLKHELEMKYGNNTEGATPLEKHILTNEESRLAIEYKMFQPLKSDESVEIFPGDKFTLDVKNQTLTFHQNLQNEDFLLQKNEEIYSNDYGEKMFDSDNNSKEVIKETEQIIEKQDPEKFINEDKPSAVQEDLTNQKVNETIKEEGGGTPIAEEGNTVVVQEKTEPVITEEPEKEIIEIKQEPEQKIYDPKEDLENKNINKENTEEKPITEPIRDKDEPITDQDIKETLGRMYTQDNLATEPKYLYHQNLEHIFGSPGEPRHDYSLNTYLKVENNPADNFLEINPNEKWPTEYKELHSYVHKLEEVSGLKPIPQTETHRAETINQFMVRAIEKIDQMGKLDKLKL